MNRIIFVRTQKQLDDLIARISVENEIYSLRIDFRPNTDCDILPLLQKVVERSTQLKSLSIIRSPISITALETLETIITTLHLGHLHLARTPIEPEGWSILLNALQHETCGLDYLGLFRIPNLTISQLDQLGSAISKNKRLRKFHIGGFHNENITSRSKFLALLSGNTTLKSLHLIDYMIDVDDLLALSNLIRASPNLESLLVPFLKHSIIFPDEIIQHFCNSIRLSIIGLAIGIVKIDSLLLNIVSMKSAKLIRLSINSQSKIELTKDHNLINSIKLNQLKTLVFTGISMNESLSLELCNFVKSNNIKTFDIDYCRIPIKPWISSLKTNNCLKHLDFQVANLDESLSLELCDAMSKNTTLKSLRVGELYDKVTSNITKMLSITTSLTTFDFIVIEDDYDASIDPNQKFINLCKLTANWNQTMGTSIHSKNVFKYKLINQMINGDALGNIAFPSVRTTKHTTFFLIWVLMKSFYFKDIVRSVLDHSWWLFDESTGVFKWRKIYLPKKKDLF